MANVITENKVKCWVDNNGNNVPVKYIDKTIVKREKMLVALIKKALKLEEKLKKEKDVMVSLIQDYLDAVATSYGENWKGNTVIRSFDQSMKVEVNISEYIEFDERLQIAKSLIDSCIVEWSKGSSNEISTLIKSAFRTDKHGRINVKQILQLRQHKFNNKKWIEAMDIISDSINVVNSKAYYKFFAKNEDGEWKPIHLNFSSI